MQKTRKTAAINANSNQLVEDSIDIEKEELKKQLAEMERKINAILSTQPSIQISQPEKKSEELTSDSYIPVMSLLFNTLTLSTREIGKGTINFTRFGEVKQVVYSDLIRIMENHPTFVRDGRFYIMDSRVVRKHGLDEEYSKLLTKETIDLILEGDKQKSVKLYESAGEKQREIINERVVLKIMNDSASVDLNVVDAFSRISGVNLLEKARISKEYIDAQKEEEEKLEKA